MVADCRTSGGTTRTAISMKGRLRNTRPPAGGNVVTRVKPGGTGPEFGTVGGLSAPLSWLAAAAPPRPAAPSASHRPFLPPFLYAAAASGSSTALAPTGL